MESLHKKLAAARQRLKQVKDDVRRHEKPDTFIGRINSAVVNCERIAEAKHEVRMAELEIETEKYKSKLEKLKSGGIDDFDDESDDDWDEEED